MPDIRKLDARLKRLAAIEHSYRAEIKRAEESHSKGLISKEKLEKIRAKYESKIESLLPKVRKLRQRRSELKAA